MTQKRKDITYFNVTPAVATWPILEAQGFVPYCRGLYFSVPALVARRARHDGRSRHAGHGLRRRACRMRNLRCSSAMRNMAASAWYAAPPKKSFPSFFSRLRKRRGIIPLPAMQLGYCRSIADYVRCAGAIGRYLLWRGKPIVIVDANGAVAGLARHLQRGARPQIFQGPAPTPARRSRRHRTRDLRHVKKKPIRPLEAYSRIEPSEIRA